MYTEGLGTIYQIYCKVNKRKYIGQTKDYPIRMSTHITKLAKGLHENYLLQEDWNKYGITSFEFTVLEEVEIRPVNSKSDYIKTNLDVLERKYIKQNKTFTKDHRYGYNLTAGGCGVDKKQPLKPKKQRRQWYIPYMLLVNGQLTRVFHNQVDGVKYLQAINVLKKDIPQKTIKNTIEMRIYDSIYGYINSRHYLFPKTRHKYLVNTNTEIYVIPLYNEDLLETYMTVKEYKQYQQDIIPKLRLVK